MDAIFYIPSNLVIALVLTALLMGYNIRVGIETVRKIKEA